jgi:PTS system nitrogen regulatory IIA component
MTVVQGSWNFQPGKRGFKGLFDPKNLLRMLREWMKKEKPVSLAEYLDDRLVIFLDVQTQIEAIETLIEALDAAHKLKDKKAFYQAIMDREKIVSTGIGLGVAIPHAKLEGYEDFFIAVGIQGGRGIEWYSLDGSQVHLIFMIGGPDHLQTEYLNILSKLTLAIKDPERRQSLLKATSARQVIDLFKTC